MFNPYRSIAKGGVALLTVVATFGVAVASASASTARAGVYQDGYHCTVVGGHNNATLHGTPGSVVCAMSGNHTLIAGGGNEVLIGGTGNDHLVASLSKTSRDVLIGGKGTDTLTGGAGSDTLIAGSGNDKLIAGTGTQYLYGGPGTDLLQGSKGKDTLVAGSGRNTLIAGTGATTLVGGTGNDILTAGRLTKSVLGGRGKDTIKLGSSIGAHVDPGSGASSLDCGASSGTTIVTDHSAHESSSCHAHGNFHVSDQSYVGLVTAVNGLLVTVQYSSANDVAHTWLTANGSPSTVTFDFTGATIESSTGSSTPNVGDFVWVDASTPSSGLLLPALFVHIHSTTAENEGQLRFRGQVTAISGNLITVQYSDVNDTAQAWLDANSDPTSVIFDITSATVTDQGNPVTLAVGNSVSVHAQTPAPSATVLTATTVHVRTADDQQNELQRYAGVVASVSGTQLTVTYADENDSAQTWLNSTFGVTLPTTVTVDIAAANIEPAATTPVAGMPIIFSATPPTSGTVLVGVDVFFPPAGGDGHGGGHEGDHHGLQRYTGQVTAITGNQVTVLFSDNNAVAQTWLSANANPTSVTFDISAATIQSDSGTSTPVVGDFVKVDATTPSSGTILPAVSVEINGQGSEGEGGGGDQNQNDQRYFGQVTAVAGSQITVQYTDNNDAAQGWLNANANPATVTFDISSATIVSDTSATTPGVGDFVGVDATTPVSGLVLPAVTVHIHGSGGGGEGHPSSDQLYFGQVTAVAGTQVTVQYFANNSVAQTWLNANANPTTVTFDISTATVQSDSGATAPVVGDLVGVAATTPVSGTVLTAVIMVIHHSGG